MSRVRDALSQAGMPSAGAVRAFNAHTAADPLKPTGFNEAAVKAAGGRPPIGETVKPGRTFSADGGFTLGAIGTALALGAAGAIGSRLANAAIDRASRRAAEAGAAGKGGGRGGAGRG